jgi:integrase
MQKLKAKYAHTEDVQRQRDPRRPRRWCLRVAVEWGVLSALPKIRKLKRHGPDRFAFYDEVSLTERLDRGGGRGRRAQPAGGAPRRRRRAARRRDRGAAPRPLRRRARRPPRRGERLARPRRAAEGNRPRQVVMTSRLRALLRAMKKRSEDVQGRVIARSRGEGTATSTVIVGLLRKAQKAAGLPLTGTHILRHTFCSRLAARGGDTEGDPGARGPRELEHDRSLHAPRPRRAADRDRPHRGLVARARHGHGRAAENLIISMIYRI